MTIKAYRTAVLPPQSATITAPRFNVGSIDNVGVHLVDESGVEGFGYAYVFDRHSAKAVAELIEGFADAYVGTEPHELRRVRSTLLIKKVNFLGLRGLARLAAAALDMAAWDLLCKLHDTNLMGLVGLERIEVPGFTAAGLWSGLSPEECARIAPQVAEEFHSPHVKMWLGSSDLGFEAERVAAVRQALAPGAGLIIDAAQAYDWRTAARLARKVEDLDILWFEDPVEYEDLDGLAALGEESPVPLGTGEHVYGIDHLKQHLDLGALQYLVLDMERIGGITDFLAAAALCDAYRVQLVNHCFPHPSMQVLATAGTGSWCELAPLWDGYFGKLDVRDGMVQLDLAARGIGLEFVHPPT
jgi:L-alanine-DL-glutamate epimerase-like enolase superfamily enzyme